MPPRKKSAPASVAAEVASSRIDRESLFPIVAVGASAGGLEPLRDCCVFARQNLTKDPRFSKLDLVSCRNVLVYPARCCTQNVAPSDIGRAINDVKIALAPENLDRLVEKVIAAGEVMEIASKIATGGDTRCGSAPARQRDGKIDGAVIVLV